ncbi:transposase [Desulfobacterales bacterium HSG2]|nr:transposase [Desulfobacterales bacterium HSG2]
MIRGRIPRKASETCPGFRVKPDLFSCDSWSETQKPADRYRDETESTDKESYMPRTHSPEEKIEILKEHIIDGKPLETVCEEHRIHPETFMKWQKELFEYGDLTFRRTPQDGMDYFHSYDLFVNWLSEAFRGQTLGVLGVSTGEIRRVCSYKPVEIAVSAGVVDVIFEETGGKAWHLEEQRSMTEKDLYRFASQHFSAAGEWRDDITDILLTSGVPYTGRREIRTPTGTYAPLIIDLTERDGPGRLAEIRESLDRGDSSVLLELVFLPLYGKDTDPEHSRFVREVLRFEIDLYKQDRMPVLLLAATLIMSNREIDKTTFQELWEEIKMLKIFEYAREMIMEEGRLENAREMLMAVLQESVGAVPGYLADEVMSVSRHDVLKDLVRQAVKCREIEEFEKMLKQATRQPAE